MPDPLSNNRWDHVTLASKIGLGMIPLVGGSLAELAGAFMPNQKLDRLVQYTVELAARIDQRGETSSPSGKRPLLEDPVADFVGREQELAAETRSPGSGVTVTVIHGMGGAGKTQFARKMMSRTAKDFPCALEINLYGTTPGSALTVQQLLTELVRATSPEGKDVPADVPKLDESWQSFLRSRPVLLLLDNAADAAQVRPVLPRSAGHHVFITTRSKFTVPGCSFVELGGLNGADSCKLLSALAPHLSAEQALLLAKECSCLPLALRLAGSFLRNRPDLPFPSYLAELQRHRLPLLDQAASESGEPGITATLELSYQSLPSPLQRRWRLLSVFPAGFDAAAASAVWSEPVPPDVPLVDDHVLAEFRRMGLLNWNATHERYSLHDLLREFARARMGSGEETQSAARHALFFSALLSRLDQDTFLASGRIASPTLATFQRELPNIIAGWKWASLHSAEEDVRPLLAGFCDNSGELLAAFTEPSLREALYREAIAPLTGHPRAALLARFGLLRAQYDRGGKLDHAEVVAFREIIAEAARLDLAEVGVNARVFYGRFFNREGNLTRALAAHRDAVAYARRQNEPRVLTRALSQLARTCLDAGELEEGERINAEALRIAERNGYGQYAAGGRLSASRLLSLRAAAAARRGENALQRRCTDEAIEMQEAAVNAARAIGTLKLLNIALFSLGRSLLIRGRDDDWDRALACFQESLQLNMTLGNLRGEAGAWLDIGKTQRLLGRALESRASLERSLALQQQIESKTGEAESLEALIKLLVKTEPNAARAYLERCREIYRHPALQRYQRRGQELEQWVRARLK